MTPSLMISLLKQAETGADMLEILDTIATKDEAVEYTEAVGEPTLDPIAF